MELYSIQGLEDKLLSTNSLRELKNGERLNKSLDRHHYIIHCIIIKSFFKRDLEITDFVNIGSDVLKKYLGRKYSDIINNLSSINAIEVNDIYSPNRFSKSYRINPNWGQDTTPLKVSVKSKFFFNKLNETNKIQVEQLKNDPILSKILTNTQKLFLIDEPLSFLPPRDSKSELKEWIPNTGIKMNFVEYFNNPVKVFRYEEFRKSLLTLNSILDTNELVNLSAFFRPVKPKSGRVYHFVGSIPRKIRKGLRTKDMSLIYEVDMASAQPTILMLEWLRSIRNSGGLNNNKEADRCKSLIFTGGIYKYIQDNSTYFQSLEYNDLKTKILKTLNDRDYSNQARNELILLFPQFMQFIRKIKKDCGYKKVSEIGQKTEAKIFITTYKELDSKIFALPIHDCILTTNEHLTEIKSILIQKTKSLYDGIIPKDENLEKVFKTAKVSFDNDELTNLNWAKYVMEQGEERDNYLEEYDNVDYEPLGAF